MTETVVVTRTGAALLGYVDPDQNRVYVENPAADVVAGDLLTLRGVARRASDVQVWNGAGAVVLLGDKPAALSDSGTLLRPSGGLVLDETTGALGAASTTTIWSGPCLVEPAQSDGTVPEIGDQEVGVVPFTVTLPLSLTNIRPGDLFKVTASQDARLLLRTLVVKAVRASSTDGVRELLAFDNQGGA